MSTLNWCLLSIVHSLNKVKLVAKSNGVSQHGINSLKNATKFSLKRSQYRKYPLCTYELKATVLDHEPNLLTVMFRSTHNHEYHVEASRLPSPV